MPTGNHSLNTPKKGAEGWHEPLNENFEWIDSLLRRISSDGATYSPDTLEANEISLGGSKRTTWPSGDLYSSDPTTATDKIIVPDTAADIQTAVDTLDGTKSGYEDGSGSMPGGGAIMLKRKEYAPESTIEMRSGVRIIGCQPDLLLGRSNNQWQYSILSGRNLESGDPIVEYPENPSGDQQHGGLHNLVITGVGNDVHGIKINRGFGSTYHSNVIITRCRGIGFWTRGSYDTWLRDVSCKDNGSSSSNNSLGYDAPSVRIQSADDNVGTGSPDTQIRWLGGRISANDTVPTVEARSSLQRFFDCTIKRAAEPATDTPVIDFTQGSMLTLMRCTIDGYRNEHSIGIERGNNQVKIGDSMIEKCGIGLRGPGNNQGMIANTKIRKSQRYGIVFGGRGALMSNVDIRGTSGDAIFVDNANMNLPWSNIHLNDNEGYAIRISGVGGGKPGDVPVVSNLHATANGNGETNAPELLIVDGKFRKPPTYELDGSVTTLSVSDKPANPMDVRLDPGGGSSTVQGIDGLTRDGRVVVMEHGGSGTVTLSHRDSSSSYPLVNSAQTDEALTSNGQVVAYRFDGQRNVWREIWGNKA